jgi:S-adenosylmethionine:tRNA ribosyltransferase-isomerase
MLIAPVTPADPCLLRTADFDYDLPPELIAARPLGRRDDSRMLVVDRASGEIEHRMFRDLPGFLRPGDRLALNNTQVVKARLFSEDGRIELLRLEVVSAEVWRCLVKPGRKMRLGARISVAGCVGEVTALHEGDGSRSIRWLSAVPDLAVHGQLALPHYMERPAEATDDERYQTTYADPAQAGAIAAPTAGLHFTPEMLASLPHAFLTLHVGVGTFRPVQAELIADHVMHAERYEISAETAQALTVATRIIAVGTTVARVLEHQMLTHGALRAEKGETAIFMHPPFEFRAVGALLTNFHLPQSTLLMLVSALAGPGLIRRAYERAVAERYRFFSYGDCMLIL